VPHVIDWDKPLIFTTTGTKATFCSFDYSDADARDPDVAVVEDKHGSAYYYDRATGAPCKGNDHPVHNVEQRGLGSEIMEGCPLWGVF
jgi:hypothetical protein